MRATWPCTVSGHFARAFPLLAPLRRFGLLCLPLVFYFTSRHTSGLIFSARSLSLHWQSFVNGLCANLSDSYRPRFPWVGIFIAFEWHLAWAAMSGMETLLHGLIVTTVLVLLMTNTPRYLTLGLLTGLAVWVRPDGLTLLGPVLMTILLLEQDARSRITSLTRYLIGFGSLFVPYLLFNLAIGGTPMPNTFYAKQAEYIDWQTLPIIERLGQLFLQLLVGPSLVLLPGVIGWLVISIQQKMWGSLAALIWCVGYFALYISRLPVVSARTLHHACHADLLFIWLTGIC